MCYKDYRMLEFDAILTIGSILAYHLKSTREQSEKAQVFSSYLKRNAGFYLGVKTVWMSIIRLWKQPLLINGEDESKDTLYSGLSRPTHFTLCQKTI